MPSRPKSLLLAIALVMIGHPALATPAIAQSDLPFPMHFPQDPEVTEFSNDWGARRSGGRRHIGNDLMAPKMTSVYSIADGVVLKVASSARAGRYVIIGHEAGWESYYIHLNDDNLGTDDGAAFWFLTVATGVYVGADVTAGQLIGWVGDSGNAEGGGPHTHFELHRDGRPVNPYPYLVAALERQRNALNTGLMARGVAAFYID